MKKCIDIFSGAGMQLSLFDSDSMVDIQNNSDPHYRYAFVLKLIPIGEENAISMRELSSRMGCTERITRKRISEIRKDGNIIASSNKGYFIPKTKQECREYHHKIISRLKNESEAFRPARKLCESIIKEGSGIEWREVQ